MNTAHAFSPPSLDAQERMVEAMLFAATAPLTAAQLASRMPLGCDVPEAVAALRRRYAGRGVEVARVGDGWALRTAADLAFLMEEHREETRRLGRAATETLAIVAYHQPVTRAEIEEIRGVAVGRGTLDTLIEIGWVRIGRRRMTPGRPATFLVTDAFLDHFGLEGAGDLPGLEELRAAGLLDRGAGLAPGAGRDDMQPEDQDEDAVPGDLFGASEEEDAP